jgi:hypothetical protein
MKIEDQEDLKKKNRSYCEKLSLFILLYLDYLFYLD